MEKYRNRKLIGHGGYAEGIRSNLEMVAEIADKDILFCCNLPGATPFQVAAVRTAENLEKYRTVVGLNNMAYMEMAMVQRGQWKNWLHRQ